MSKAASKSSLIASLVFKPLPDKLRRKNEKKLLKRKLKKARKLREQLNSQAPVMPISMSDPNVEERIFEADGRKLRLEDVVSWDIDKLAGLSDEEADDLLHTWPLWARPNQLEPTEPYTTWLILAGRGFGKTRTGAETVIEWARSGQCKRIALVAEDSADARDVMVEGESGIMACSPRDFRPKYEPSKKRLTWPNGAMATCFSAEDYDSLRGPQFDGAWCDELCKWRYAQEAWDNLQFGLRLGDNPKQIVTTTPRPLRLLKDIILRSDTYITKGTTMENLVNLAAPFKMAVVAKYEGTRIGRQELNAEILDDVPGALWSRVMIDMDRITPVDPLTPVRLPDMKRIVVAVDPAKEIGEGAAETGIMVCGIDANNHGYLLQDCSILGTPEEWGRRAVQAFDEWEADMMVYEANQGGEMVASVLRAAAKNMREQQERTADFVPMKDVHATKGKYVRAEPISQLYEQHKMHHVGHFPELEDQMCEYTPDGSMGYSPDRMDAMVWGFTELLIAAISYEGLMDFMRAESQAVTDRLMGVVRSDGILDAVVSLKAPSGINTAYGAQGEKYLMKPDGTFDVKESDVKALVTAGFARFFTKTNKGVDA